MKIEKELEIKSVEHKQVETGTDNYDATIFKLETEGGDLKVSLNFADKNVKISMGAKVRLIIDDPQKKLE